MIDASRQYAVNEYDSHYAQRISMYSNILPPLGFIGTTSGLLILFFSMHAASASLELGALALALVSSILALMGFAVLEGLKIGLYGRLLSCLDHALETAQRSRPPAACRTDRDRKRGLARRALLPSAHQQSAAPRLCSTPSKGGAP